MRVIDTANPPDARPDVAAALARLTETERDVLLVLALSDDCLARREWLAEIKARGLWVRGDAPVGNGTLKEIDRRLTAAGLVQSPRPGSFEVDPSLALDVIAAADKESRGRVDGMLGPDRYVWHKTVGRLRVAIARRDTAAVERTMSGMHRADLTDPTPLITRTLGRDLRPQWLALLPDESRDALARGMLRDGVSMLRFVPTAVTDLAASSRDAKVRLLLMRWRSMTGVADPAEGLGKLPKWGAEGGAVLSAFWRGDYARAAEVGDAAVAQMGSRKTRFLPDLEGLAYAIASVSQITVDPGRRQRVFDMLVHACEQRRGNSELLALAAVTRRLVEASTERPRVLAWWSDHSPAWTSAWLEALVRAWWPSTENAKPGGGSRYDKERFEELVGALGYCGRLASAHGYGPVAAALDDARAAVVGTARPGGLAASFVPPEPWKAALASVEAVAEAIGVEASSPSTKPAEASIRWEVFIGEREAYAQPRLVKSSRARKGSQISIDRLTSDELADVLTAADRKAIAAIETEEDPWGYGTRRHDRQFFGERAIEALIGHPGVIDGEGGRVEVVAGNPRLCTVATPAGVRATMFPSALARRELVVEEPETGRVVVYRRPAGLEGLAAVMATEDGVVVPEDGRERLGRALAVISARSGIELVGELAAPTRTRPADARPVFDLQWDGHTLLVAARVAPLGVEGPHVAPGQGAAILVAAAGARDRGSDVPTALLRCERDHVRERTLLSDVLDRCPNLVGFAASEMDWAVPGLTDALSVVEELHGCGDDVVLAWRKGKQLYPPKTVDLPDLEVKVRGAGMTMALSAKLQADEGLVLGFEALLAAREGGRFVRLSDAKVVALSKELQRRIDGLSNLGGASTDGDGVLSLSAAALPAIAALLDGVTTRYDAKTKKRLQALEEIANRTPRMPRGFGNVLRDYQREGVVWIWRLAAAGFGACLADDMGLGKTVQALAILADRSASGPALVVCPTSVVFNWRRESERFAPGLRVRVLAAEADRAACIEDLGPGDVLVVSYGLLVTEIERLEKVTLSTVVFDEAHAVKNATTKRSRAARRLDAGFTLALTGTPIENNLGELWSLMDLIVPGLLGGRESFVECFANPIADGHREPLRQLRAIVRHFVLRRTKAQVLDELPPRTDTTLVVEPSSAARAFYEAMRRRARKKVDDAPSKHKKIVALAEITKLRQAAVDPRLCDPTEGPPGDKIDLLLQELSRLAESDHRALVFTQFLDSLALIEEGLRRAGIAYQTLQGKTSAAERERRIAAFGAGEGTVFLASLRAGGIGVNLTAADFVFHVDPWWNPAVEDQATDRAHRIGQTRPVNVYRLVTAGTIEEKILELHERKRGLADDLLHGLGEAKGLDLEELVRLLS